MPATRNRTAPACDSSTRLRGGLLFLGDSTDCGLAARGCPLLFTPETANKTGVDKDCHGFLSELHVCSGSLEQEPKIGW
jgi:hypothetical protein